MGHPHIFSVKIIAMALYEEICDRKTCDVCDAVTHWLRRIFE
jgi:hypothetical protein